jgi:hypothetical protein
MLTIYKFSEITWVKNQFSRKLSGLNTWYLSDQLKTRPHIGTYPHHLDYNTCYCVTRFLRLQLYSFVISCLEIQLRCICNCGYLLPRVNIMCFHLENVSTGQYEPWMQKIIMPSLGFEPLILGTISECAIKWTTPPPQKYSVPQIWLLFEI